MAYGARPQTAGGYAQQAARQKSYSRHKLHVVKNMGGGNIFDRLTDSSKYTGTHKHRFDASGRGRGLDGRDRVSKGGFGLGVSPNSREAQYKGNTNTNTDVIYNDLSDFIVRR